MIIGLGTSSCEQTVRRGLKVLAVVKIRIFNRSDTAPIRGKLFLGSDKVSVNRKHREIYMRYSTDGQSLCEAGTLHWGRGSPCPASVPSSLSIVQTHRGEIPGIQPRFIATHLDVGSQCQIAGKRESNLEPRRQDKKLYLLEANQALLAIQLFLKSTELRNPLDVLGS